MTPTQPKTRWFKISDAQLTALRKGWTHTSLNDKKGILQSVWDDQMFDCASPGTTERDTVLNEKELQYLNCLIKKDIIDYPKGWCTLPHIEPTLQQNVLKKIESLRTTEAHR